MTLVRVGLLLCVFGLGVALVPTLRSQMGQQMGKTATPALLPTRAVVIHTRNGRLVRVRVAVAITPTEQATGLTGKSNLAPDEGELFVFGQPGQPEFWMRGVAIPLSVAFIVADGTIVDIRDLAPFDERRVSPSAAIDMALEVPIGSLARSGVSVGDHVELSLVLDRLSP